MAKDPAFLFYTGDFTTGTQFLSDEQVGKYIRLLMAQHQHGRLSEKQVIIICKIYDSDIMAKFKKDTDGFFYNERLESEISKRKAFSESRSNNKKGKTKDLFMTSKSYDNHMEDINENENKEEVLIIKKEPKNKNFIPPEFSEFESYCFEHSYGGIAKKAFDYYSIANWKDGKGSQVKNWKQKLQGVWFKEENKGNGTSKQSYIDNLKDNARKAIDSQYKDLSQSYQAGEEDNRSNDLPVY